MIKEVDKHPTCVSLRILRCSGCGVPVSPPTTTTPPPDHHHHPTHCSSGRGLDPSPVSSSRSRGPDWGIHGNPRPAFINDPHPPTHPPPLPAVCAGDISLTALLQAAGHTAAMGVRVHLPGRAREPWGEGGRYSLIGRAGGRAGGDRGYPGDTSVYIKPPPLEGNPTEGAQFSASY